MALASAPTTPERPIKVPSVRRAFTAPIKPYRRSLPPKERQNHDADTLYAHEAAKIVSFTTSNPNRRNSVTLNPGALLPEDTSATLPWASVTERTVAAGPLRIYRVLGSVAFLHSGNILQPMLAKSQCWCVDGVSKFVLRIRENSYYRIELPSTDDYDENRVDQLKATFDKILQYEKTPCPFKRSFTVELPESPETPVKKVPWRPKRPEPAQSSSPALKPREYDETNVEGLEKQRMPEGLHTGSVRDLSLHSPAEKVADFPSEPSDASSGANTDFEFEKESLTMSDGNKTAPKEAPFGNTTVLRVPKRRQRSRVERTATAPSQPTRKHRTSTAILVAPSGLNQDEKSFASSSESFHSWQSPVSSRPHSRSPSSSNATIQYQTDKEGLDPHQAVGFPSSTPLRPLSDGKSLTSATRDISPKAPNETSPSRCVWTEVKTPSPPGLRVRRTLEKRRTQSPLPPSADLYPPYAPDRSLSRARFADELVKRTVSMLLRPPLKLVTLMVKIALGIARGTLQGSSFGFGERGESIPCSWDFSSDGSVSSEDLSDEDDYGVKLGRTVSGRRFRLETSGGSWEID